jgi:hypothetical protein
VDETRLAYVQVRFSGYVQKVFADATYQYVRKGQPLLTIYSPDLVATEREYLVAKQNQKEVAQSTVPGVVSSAASLLDASVERLKQWGVSQHEISRLESTSEVQQNLKLILRFLIHHRTKCSAQCRSPAGYASLYHRRSLTVWFKRRFSGRSDASRAAILQRST